MFLMYDFFSVAQTQLAMIKSKRNQRIRANIFPTVWGVPIGPVGIGTPRSFCVLPAKVLSPPKPPIWELVALLNGPVFSMCVWAVLH